jgi:hypothetical protein
MDLREHYRKSPLAFALLVEPSWIREDPSVFVIRGDYGPLFGAHSFRSTIYSMQDPGTAGAKCAQMCAIMVLGMLADRGVEVKGSFTLTYLSWQQESSRSGKLKQAARADKSGTMKIDGLLPEQLQRVLIQCGSRARLYQVKPERRGAEELATRIIEANIKARFPVILAVDSAAWSGKEPGTTRGPDGAPLGHAVTVVGIRRSTLNGQPVSFIVHDPASGPFQNLRTDRCTRAARTYQVKKGGRWQAADEIRFVAAATKSIDRSLGACLRWLDERDYESDSSVYAIDGAAFETFAPYREVADGTDYQMRLLNRNSILNYLRPLLDRGDAGAVPQLTWALDSLSDSRYWAIIGFRIDKDNVTRLSVMWLFDAREELTSAPVLKLWRSPDGPLRQSMRFSAFDPR